MGQNKAFAHHTSTYFHTRHVSYHLMTLVIYPHEINLGQRYNKNWPAHWVWVSHNHAVLVFLSTTSRNTLRSIRWRMRGIEGPAAVVIAVANNVCFRHRLCLGGTKVMMGGGRALRLYWRTQATHTDIYIYMSERPVHHSTSPPLWSVVDALPLGSVKWNRYQKHIRHPLLARGKYSLCPEKYIACMCVGHTPTIHLV